MVTSAPKDFQTLANSTPMTPPPRMTTLLGHVVELRGPGSLVMTRPPMLEAGQRAGVGAGGQDDVPAAVALAVDLDGVVRDELALALDR